MTADHSNDAIVRSRQDQDTEENHLRELLRLLAREVVKRLKAEQQQKDSQKPR